MRCLTESDELARKRGLQVVEHRAEPLRREERFGQAREPSVQHAVEALFDEVRHLRSRDGDGL